MSNPVHPVIVLASALSLALGIACSTMHRGSHDSHDSHDSHEESDEGDEAKPSVEVIHMSDLPELVRQAFLGIAAESSAQRIERETDDETTSYEIDYSGGSVTIADTGEIMETEQPIDRTKVPASVLRAIEDEIPHASVEEVQLVRRTYYECKLRVDGRVREVQVELSGKMEEASD